VQAAYIEVTPAGTSPSSATTAPETLSASTQVTITAAGTTNVPSVTWGTPAAIAYGTALSGTQLNATANVPGVFVYTPAAGTVLTAGTQTLSVNLHAFRYQHLFCGDRQRAVECYPGQPGDHLGNAGCHLGGHSSQRGAVERHRQRPRQLPVQPRRPAPFQQPERRP
jgi:hypothetical protein